MLGHSAISERPISDAQLDATGQPAVGSVGYVNRTAGPSLPFKADPRGYTLQSVSFSVTASGGLTFGGTAPMLRVHAAGAAGGVVIGGAASVVRVSARLASGGLSFNGAATQVRVAAQSAPSGGPIFGGAASVSFFVNAALNYNATWQRTTAGPSLPFRATLRGYTQPPQSLSVTASGGFVFGGTAAMSSINAALYTVAWGGRQMGPAMDFAPSLRGYPLSITQSYAYTPVGGLTISGSAGLLRARLSAGAGGFGISGASAQARIAARSTSGQITLSGAAGYSTNTGSQSYSYSASGGTSFSGLANEIRVRVVASAGGFSFGGAATYAGVPAGSVIASMRRFNRQRSWRRFKTDAMDRR